eukprot:352924-Rhodomonas_salina.1
MAAKEAETSSYVSSNVNSMQCDPEFSSSQFNSAGLRSEKQRRLLVEQVVAVHQGPQQSRAGMADQVGRVAMVRSYGESYAKSVMDAQARGATHQGGCSRIHPSQACFSARQLELDRLHRGGHKFNFPIARVSGERAGVANHQSAETSPHDDADKGHAAFDQHLPAIVSGSWKRCHAFILLLCCLRNPGCRAPRRPAARAVLHRPEKQRFHR